VELGHVAVVDRVVVPRLTMIELVPSIKLLVLVLGESGCLGQARGFGSEFFSSSLWVRTAPCRVESWQSTFVLPVLRPVSVVFLEDIPEVSWNIFLARELGCDLELGVLHDFSPRICIESVLGRCRIERLAEGIFGRF
jgi:hypothetical protein